MKVLIESKRKFVLLITVVFATVFLVWFYNRVVFTPVLLSKPSNYELIRVSDTHMSFGPNWIRKNENGNWESYIEGAPHERGQALGVLHEYHIKNQEVAFINEIQKRVPKFIQPFLLLGVAWFNRDLDETIPKEYLIEMAHASEFFSDDYNWIGPKYNRIVNYHAAHDIGHAVQNMHIVACTAFGEWNYTDSSSYMLFGRNFDFYFGDEFSKEKMVLFVNPDEGHAYSSVTWGGFMGIVSGLNEKGLGVTLNAIKSEIPKQSGTPVSIIARQILQYASTIAEADSIAGNYKSFVAESFTISSAIDKKIATIEKTPTEQFLYLPEGNRIVVTNHCQSTELEQSALNLEHMKSSESVDRFDRTVELLEGKKEATPESFVDILRDQKGKGGNNIGVSNPKLINQLLAHHAVVFDNTVPAIWVSNYPFQEGDFDGYNLGAIESWQASSVQHPIAADSIQIDSDPFLLSSGYMDFQFYKELRESVMVGIEGGEIDTVLIDKLIDLNPEYFEAYKLAGMFFASRERVGKARENFRLALTKDIPYLEERIAIEEKLLELKQ